MKNEAKIDFTDTAAITGALAGSADPLRAACAVLGVAVAIIEDRKDRRFAREFLLEAARRMS